MNLIFPNLTIFKQLHDYSHSVLNPVNLSMSIIKYKKAKPKNEKKTSSILYYLQEVFKCWTIIYDICVIKHGIIIVYKTLGYIICKNFYQATNKA